MMNSCSHVGCSYVGKLQKKPRFSFCVHYWSGKSYFNCSLFALKVKDRVFQWIFSTKNTFCKPSRSVGNFLIFFLFFFSILLSVYLLILLPWPFQRGLLLEVNWELVTVLVYRVVSWGLTCVKTGLEDWLDFCKVVSPCFLSCVPENLIWLRTWLVRNRMTERLNDWLVGWLYIKRTDWPSLSMTNKLLHCVANFLTDW